MRKRKLLITVIAGCLAIMNVFGTVPVMAADEPVTEAVSEVAEAQDMEETDPELTETTDEMAMDGIRVTSTEDEPEDQLVLSPQEEETDQEEETVSEIEPVLETSDSEEKSMTNDSEKTDDESEKEESEENAEKEFTHSTPYGEASVSAGYTEITSLDLSQSYSFSYSETDRDGRDEYTDSSVLRFSLDTGFNVQTIQTGEWNGLEGGLCICLYGKSGGLAATLSAYQGSSLDVSMYEGISLIEISAGNYADRISDLSISGSIDEETVGDPVTLSAAYGSADLSSNYAEASVSTPTTYIGMPLPETDITSDELYYGESTEFSMADYSCEYVPKVSRVVFTFGIPESLSLTKLTVPSFKDAEVSVLADGSEVETEDGEAAFADRVSEITLTVTPKEGVLAQESVLKISLKAVSEDAGTCSIQSSVRFLFEDESEKEFTLEKTKVSLKGIHTKQETDPDPTTVPDTPPVDPEPAPEPEENPDAGKDTKDETEKDQDTEEESDSNKEEKKKDTEDTPVVVVKVIDHTGLDFGNATASVSDTGLHDALYEVISESSQEAETEDYFDHEKIQTASVDDVSDAYDKIHYEDNVTDPERISSELITDDPVVTQEEEINAVTQRNSVSVPVIIAVIAGAVAGVLLFLIGIRKKKKGNDNDIKPEDKENI